MQIRQASEEDFESWLQLRMEFWPETPPEQHRQDIGAILAAPAETAFLGIGPTGEPVGLIEVSLRQWAEGCRTSPVGYVEGWYMAPHRRKNGEGAQLMRAAEEWARAQGCSEMASDADLSNDTSAAAHQRLGYAVVARITCFRKSLLESLVDR